MALVQDFFHSCISKWDSLKKKKKKAAAKCYFASRIYNSLIA